MSKGENSKGNRRPIYYVYEVSKDCREHGRFLKSYKTKKLAYKFMEKSIYRYILEYVLVDDCLVLPKRTNE